MIVAVNPTDACVIMISRFLLISTGLLAIQAQEAPPLAKQEIFISVIQPYAPLGFERTGVLFGNIPAIQNTYAIQKYVDKLNADERYFSLLHAFLT